MVSFSVFTFTRVRIAATGEGLLEELFEMLVTGEHREKHLTGAVVVFRSLTAVSFMVVMTF